MGRHAVEAAAGILAGVIASSVALVGFGTDSVIEEAAPGSLCCGSSRARVTSGHAERRAQQLIAASFVLLAAYITVESTHDLLGGHHPAFSWVGVGLAAISLAAMLPLAAAKRRIAGALDSSAAGNESRQTILCAYLSGRAAHRPAR